MLNQAQLIGNLGVQPEVHTFENGDKVVKFSLATNESYKNKDGEKVNKTTWHNIVVYGNLVDIIEKYVNKGDPIFVQGKITNRSYESNGDTKYITEIVLDKFNGVMKMLGGKKDGDSGSSTPPPPAESGGNEPLETNDLPF